MCACIYAATAWPDACCHCIALPFLLLPGVLRGLDLPEAYSMLTSIRPCGPKKHAVRWACTCKRTHPPCIYVQGSIGRCKHMFASMRTFTFDYRQTHTHTHTWHAHKCIHTPRHIHSRKSHVCMRARYVIDFRFGMCLSDAWLHGSHTTTCWCSCYRAATFDLLRHHQGKHHDEFDYMPEDAFAFLNMQVCFCLSEQAGAV